MQGTCYNKPSKYDPPCMTPQVAQWKEHVTTSAWELMSLIPSRDSDFFVVVDQLQTENHQLDAALTQ